VTVHFASQTKKWLTVPICGQNAIQHSLLSVMDSVLETPVSDSKQTFWLLRSSATKKV